MINIKYKTEKYIALKNNTQRKFQASFFRVNYHLLYHRSKKYIIIVIYMQCEN